MYFHLFINNFRVPQLLVLNDCDIDRAGEPEDLRKKCCTVKELDLAQNKLQNWTEVFTILSHMPRVEFVNLSLNRLTGPVEPPPECNLSQIRNLVLNNTRSDWDSVEAIISRLPALEELHLSLNDYSEVLIDTIDDDGAADVSVYLDEDADEATNNVVVEGGASSSSATGGAVTAGGDGGDGATADVEANLCNCDKRTTKRSIKERNNL